MIDVTDNGKELALQSLTLSYNFKDIKVKISRQFYITNILKFITELIFFPLGELYRINSRRNKYQSSGQIRK